MAREDATLTRLRESAERGLNRPLGTTKAEAEKETQRLEDVGVFGVGHHSERERIEEWVKKLWHGQDDPLEEQAKEWRQNLLYCANYQHIAYHRGRRVWIRRKSVPWRIRSVYNVVQKAVNIRVSRLTENKPTVSVIAGTTERGDLEKTEYKENLFWHLWQKLFLHLKVVLVRRWASKCAMGFLKVGWDPDAGREIPVTRKRPRYVTKEQAVLDPATGQPALDEQGQPVLQPQQVYDGIEEYYVSPKEEDLGPTEEEVEDPENPGESRRVRREPPDEADVLHEGEAFVEVRSPFNIRWDKWTDSPADSWYIQDASVMPASAILAQFPDEAPLLQDAKAATEDEKALQWSGLQPRPFTSPYGGHYFTGDGTGASGQDRAEPIDKEYLVIETWVFPKNRLVRKLWGRKGALIITIGGKLLQDPTPLPRWALETCPFIDFPDTPEEGNHYGKTFIRDLIPIQDDINRSRSHEAESMMVRARLLIGAPRKSGLRVQVLGNLPASLVTYRAGFEPKPIELKSGPSGAEQFYDSSLAAAADLGNMNEASTGKLPSAGLAGKAIFALQFADERSVTEVSNLQDMALQRLAKALDWVTRVEYTETRKIRVVGKDRSFMVEHDVRPEDLQIDVDYFFVPGSMLTRQKEAIRNELISLREVGLIDDVGLRKYFPASVPEAYRQSYDLQEAKARRLLQKVLRGTIKEGDQPQPDPWDDPAVFVQVLEEFMLTRKWEVLSEIEKQLILQLWQAYRVLLQQALAPQQQPGVAPTGQVPPVAGPPESEFPTPEGVAALEAQAEAAVAQPEPAQPPATAGVGRF